MWEAGGTASYTVKLGDKPVMLRAKLLREFAAQNRLTGTVGIISVGLKF